MSSSTVKEQWVWRWFVILIYEYIQLRRKSVAYGTPQIMDLAVTCVSGVDKSTVRMFVHGILQAV